MSIWAALAGGFVGTLVLPTLLRTATELHLTRMDLPFMLGTAVTEDWARAKAIGYAAHFVLGLAFAMGYYGLFLALGRSDWWLGAGGGVRVRPRPLRRHGAGQRAPYPGPPQDGNTTQ